MKQNNNESYSLYNSKAENENTDNQKTTTAATTIKMKKSEIWLLYRSKAMTTEYIV